MGSEERFSEGQKSFRGRTLPPVIESQRFLLGLIPLTKFIFQETCFQPFIFT